jgi:hypothetical protein
MSYDQVTIEVRLDRVAEDDGAVLSGDDFPVVANVLAAGTDSTCLLVHECRHMGDL